MATVRQLVPMAGERYARAAGDVYETDEVEALRLAAAGIVDLVAGAGEVVGSYASRTKAELAAIAADRGLATEGTKAQIIARLEAAMEQTIPARRNLPPPPGPPPPRTRVSPTPGMAPVETATSRPPERRGR